MLVKVDRDIFHYWKRRIVKLSNIKEIVYGNICKG